MAGEGTNKGWISIYRKVEDGWLWEDKPFARGQAWIDLLLQANHKNKKTFSKGELVEVKRGSFLTSDQELADRWGWSRKKVRGFLEVLVGERMVALKRSPKGTSLTIENYSFYQRRGTTEEQQKNNPGYNRGTTEDTTEEQQKVQQKNTNNNDNNINNDNNVNNGIRGEGPKPPSTPPNLSKIQKLILEQFGEVTFKTWFASAKITEEKEKVEILTISKFVKEVIEQRYKNILETLTSKKIIIKEE